MAIEFDTSTSERVRDARGLALKKARKAAGLSAERLAQYVNDRTRGSDVTRHAIYSYEQGKVLLSREVGHRIADALHLHPGQLLLGDPDYPTPPAPAPGNLPPDPGAPPPAVRGSDENTVNPPAALRDTDGPGAVSARLRTELAINAARALPAAEVLARLLAQQQLGLVSIKPFIGVFHLLLGDTRPLPDSAAVKTILERGDTDGNEHPYTLAVAAVALHTLATELLDRLVDPKHENAKSLFSYLQTSVESLDQLAATIRGEIKACNKRLPGVSLEDQ